MSIDKLRQIACLEMPFTVSNDDEVDELRVLMAAGLVAGFALKVPIAHQRAGSDEAARPGVSSMIRVLAITSDGRRLLQRSGGGTDVGHDGPTSH